ncbi:hypothetical protein Esi_0027_0035 [Ectocarpus siliculosus]|uniref:Uncharacterized protein n=1 Tax=Ectocarpus siliculosus TaxID=2880 RepID=D7FUC5_ECTSI|nr:hypothetical protein Esi_0027_0035 [Ectocarpus siliculosus]|eukprot:CBJ26195.1 hypothetical protein Esi_0027_0035 [Ectocarpus siliculosus]
MTNKEDDGAHRVGSESDVVDFVEARIKLSLAELATGTGDDPMGTGDDATTTGDDGKASWASHPWDDDEHWDDYKKYLDHNSFFTEEEREEVCPFPSVWSE